MSDCLAAIGTKYQLISTDVHLTNLGTQQILRPNPKRWSLTFAGSVSINCWLNISSAVDQYLGFNLTSGQLVQFKFRDNPLLTTSEWWVFPEVANVYFTIWEEIFIG